MLEDILEIKQIGNIDVFFRKQDKQVKNKTVELEKVIKYLTNEDFEDYQGKKYKRRLINPENFEILLRFPEQYDFDSDDDETENYTCLCSENSCSHLMIIKHKPTDINMALGSVCYTRFDEDNIDDIRYHCIRKKCNDCHTPLVFKASKFIKNTNKKCDGKCYDCCQKIKNDILNAKLKEMERLMKLRDKIATKENDRVYLKVAYDDKDDAKRLGAWWDVENKKWYAPNGSSKYTMLIEKYS